MFNNEILADVHFKVGFFNSSDTACRNKRIQELVQAILFINFMFCNTFIYRFKKVGNSYLD